MRRVLLILLVGMLLMSNLLHLSVTVSDSTASTQSLALVVTTTSSPFLPIPAIEAVPTGHDRATKRRDALQRTPIFDSSLSAGWK